MVEGEGEGEGGHGLKGKGFMNMTGMNIISNRISIPSDMSCCLAVLIILVSLSDLICCSLLCS